MYRQKTAQRDPTSKAGFPRLRYQDEKAPSNSRSNEKCIDGIKGYTAKKCYILNKRLRSEDYKIQRKYSKNILEALETNETLKKRYGTAYKKLTAGNTKERTDTDYTKSTTVSYRLVPTPVTDRTVSYAAFATGTVTYPLRDSTI